jgi:small-conductance mechanosensitive channel/CRP-like cAMP-binding protein
MRALERLQQIEPVWSGLGATLIALIVLLLLRRSLPPGQRDRGRAALVLLFAALLIRLTAIGLVDWLGLWALRGPLGVLHVVTLVVGLSGLLSLVVFDLGFNRQRVRIPSILRNLIQGGFVLLILVWLWKEATDDLLSLVTTSAIVGGVIGLALQGTIANLFAGLSLQVDRTFGIGEWIKVEDTIGKILEVKWRATTLLTKDGDLVVVPNANMLGHEVHNFSQPSGAHRMWLRIGFAYRHPPNDAKTVLLGAARDVPGVLPFPEPDVIVTEFGDSAVLYALRYWITAYERDVNIHSEVMTRVWYASQRAGLEIPFPIQTEHHPEPPAVTRRAAQMERSHALARIEMFAPLPDADRDLLAAAMHDAWFAKGELLIHQGEEGQSMFLITRGDVSVRLAVDGEERELNTLHAGDFVGEMSLMTHEARTASCIALTDVTALVLDRTGFSELLAKRPEMAETISAILATRAAELEGERDQLSHAAKARRKAEVKTKFLVRIRTAFNI